MQRSSHSRRNTCITTLANTVAHKEPLINIIGYLKLPAGLVSISSTLSSVFFYTSKGHTHSPDTYSKIVCLEAACHGVCRVSLVCVCFALPILFSLPVSPLIFPHLLLPSVCAWGHGLPPQQRSTKASSTISSHYITLVSISLWCHCPLQPTCCLLLPSESTLWNLSPHAQLPALVFVSHLYCRNKTFFLYAAAHLSLSSLSICQYQNITQLPW